MRVDELATTFDRKARSFLFALDFELQNDPEKTVGRPGFAVTTANYRSPKGLYLRACFDPIDGASATLMCGRKWHYASEIPNVPDHDRLSNYYYVLARLFGFDLPSYYRLRPGDEALRTIDGMVDDLKATLATILGQVTQDHLVQVESEKYGCRWLEDKHDRNPRSSRLEAISSYPE